MTTKEAVKDQARLDELNAFVKRCTEREKEYQASIQALHLERQRLAREIVLCRRSGVQVDSQREQLESQFAAVQSQWSLHSEIYLAIDRVQTNAVNEITKEFVFDALDRKA